MSVRTSSLDEMCALIIDCPHCKCEKNMRNTGYYQYTPEEMSAIAKDLVQIANKYGLIVESCAEEINLDSIGIKHGKCIDDVLISKLNGSKLTINKDKNQRLLCGCVESIDIGAYDTCPHNCLYCYANINKKLALQNFNNHNPDYPLLDGNLVGDEKITERKMESLFTQVQTSLF